MSKQISDLLNTNVAPISFDLEELENIHATLPSTTSPNPQNPLNDIPSTTIATRNYPVFTPTTTSVVPPTDIDNQEISDSFISSEIDLDDIPTPPPSQPTKMVEPLAKVAPVESQTLAKPNIPNDKVLDTQGVDPENIHNKTINDKSTVSTHHTAHMVEPIDTTITLTQRLFNAFFIGVLFSVLGLLIDWFLHISRALTSNVATEIIWLFFPCFAIIGIIFGFLFGAQALDIVFATSNTKVDSNPDDGFSTGLLKSVGIGLGIAVVGWLVMLILL